MVRLQRSTRIEAGEIVEWAYDPDPQPPTNADANVWDLMLGEWFADDRLYADLASNEDCPKRHVFLALLRERMRKRCLPTRWAKAANEAAVSASPSPHGANGKGRGRKNKHRAQAKVAARIAVEAESAARAHAETLLAVVRTKAHPDLRELATRLEAFLADPTTIGDAFWDA